MHPTRALRSFKFPPTISQLLSRPFDEGKELTICATLKSLRVHSRIAFGVLNDGSSTKGLQATLSPALAQGLSAQARVRLTGNMTPCPPKAKQDREFQVKTIQVLGPCPPETYPLQPRKEHTVDFLRENLSLRTRTDKLAAMLRVRSALTGAIHAFFNTHSFTQVHTPIITSNDAEGGGETFTVATSDSTPFFGTPAHLTVSSQLHLESLAASHGRVYTLSPCFRAERSQTGRHLSEFWMLEGEWCDDWTVTEQGQLPSLMSFTESLIRSVVNPVLGSDDLSLLWQDKSERYPMFLNAIRGEAPWMRMSYTEAIQRLQNDWESAAQQAVSSPPDESQSALASEPSPTWGQPLSSIQERHLANVVAKGPIFIYDYPSDIKPFYMRHSSDPVAINRVSDPDTPISCTAPATVSCFDLLVPDVGELVGGSVREERYEQLYQSMLRKGLLLGVENGEASESPYDWYLDLRKYGSAPHSGFGLGLERLIAWVTSIDNVRECTPFPRWVGRCGM